MNKFKSLTEDKYTLSDIFIKNNEVFFILPLMMYLLYPLLHIVINSVMYHNPETTEEIMSYLSFGELPGDYIKPMIDYIIFISVFFTVISLISYIIKQKKSSIKMPKDDLVPLFFFAVVIILMIVSTIINGGISTDYLLGLTIRGEGLLTLFAYLMIFYLCGSFVRNEKYKYLAVYTYLSASFAVGSISILDYLNITEVPIVNFTNLSGIFYHFNFYGYFLTMAIMLSASLILTEKNKKRRIFAILMFIFNSAILTVDDTMGCFVACIAAFIFMILFISIKNKKFSIKALILFAVFLAICFILSLFTSSFFTQLLGLFSDAKDIVTNSENAANAGTDRWGLWKATLQFIKDKPLFGYGFEGTCGMLNEVTGQDKVHNEYLNWAADYGIPCAIIYFGGLCSVFIKALKKKNEIDGATFCCLIASAGYVVSAIFGNTMIFVTPFFFIFLGLSNACALKPCVAIGTEENTDLSDITSETPAEQNYTDDSSEETETDNGNLTETEDTADSQTDSE